MKSLFVARGLIDSMRFDEDVDPRRLLVRKVGKGGKIYIADAFEEVAEELEGGFVEVVVLNFRKPKDVEEGDN